ncbi:MAG TPA: hypothetical protein VJ951_01490, partial [Bacteroidales bacterium]|nr:hypothetical protein [Bacteroidales bacterium]
MFNIILTIKKNFHSSFRSTLWCLILFLFVIDLSAQDSIYIIQKSEFSHNRHDDISTVNYSKGFVFTSNRSKSFFNKIFRGAFPMFNMFYVDTSNIKSKIKVKLFTEELSSRLNDGPVTFNSNEDTAFFSRNLEIEGKRKGISGSNNKLGIFSAVKVDNKWELYEEFDYNSSWDNLRFNVTTPSLDKDRKRIYFASDMPGGYGGLDLYYSDFKNGEWETPVNMGEEINTNGDEAYPYIHSTGELFFSSDGLPGMGGMDIFVTVFNGKNWRKPIGLSPPLNSEHDELGITTN